MRSTPAAPDASATAVERLLAEATALRRGGQVDAAVRCFEQALLLAPEHPAVLTAFATLLVDTGDRRRASQLAQRAIAADPERIGAYHVLARAQSAVGDYDQACASLGRALALRPDAVELHLELGSVLQAAGDPDRAEMHLRRACDLAPDLAAARVNLANLLRRRQRADEAAALYRQAIALDPGLAQAYNNLGTLLAEQGDGEAAIAAFRQSLALAPERAATWSNFLFARNWSDRVDAMQLAEEHRAFGRYFASRVTPLPAKAIPPLAGRRLRIGYLSSDFYSHAVALFMLPLLAAHDRTRFVVHAYHNRVGGDELTDEIRERVDQFIPVAELDDQSLARRIRADAIDILVDLNGHTAGNRLLLFLLRPAPIQVTWLGYLGTTGLSCMDYRLSDGTADPPGDADRMHTETLWRLPNSLWCYQPYAGAPAIVDPPCLRQDYVRFGSFNNPGKISSGILALWIRLLQNFPQAQLSVICGGYGERIAAIKDAFATAGIAPQRLRLLPKLSTADYLALFNEVDIALDTWPCGGGTTSCDALWMGVPVITLVGDRSSSRSGASLLASLGLSELVAQQPEDYVALALALAQDRARLAALRRSLRERMISSPLLDAPRFAADLETAYLAMAQRAAAATARP